MPKSLFQTVRFVFAALVIAIFMGVGLSQAHEIRPSVMDISVEENTATTLEIRLSFTAESFLAGMDLSDLADTDDSPAASEYDRLRAFAPDDLSLLLETAFPALSQAVTIRLDDQPLTWALKDIQTEDISNPDIIRETTVIFLATQPNTPPDTLFDQDAMITVDWPPEMGGLLIRQHGEGSDASYVEFLEKGGESGGFALGEINQPSFWEIIKRYIHSGIIHIVPYGLDHILFVIGLLAFSRSGHHLLLQISLFTFAHTLTLAAASLGWVQISSSLVEPLIALSIAYIAVENLLRVSAQPEPPLRLMRGGVVFGFGLLHGLGFASVLAEFGLPDSAFLTALISFNIGVELGQLLIVVPLFVLLRLLLPKPRQYCIFFQVPVSVMIALVGLYWAIQRVGIL